MTSDSSLSVREHTTREAFAALESLWDILVKRSQNASLSMTHEWLSTWWDCLGSGKRSLLILTVEERGDTIGLAPFMEVRRRWLGIPYTSIEFISARDYAFSHLTMSGSWISSQSHGRRMWSMPSWAIFFPLRPGQPTSGSSL